MAQRVQVPKEGASTQHQSRSSSFQARNPKSSRVGLEALGLEVGMKAWVGASCSHTSMPSEPESSQIKVNPLGSRGSERLRDPGIGRTVGSASLGKPKSQESSWHPRSKLYPKIKCMDVEFQVRPLPTNSDHKPE